MNPSPPHLRPIGGPIRVALVGAGQMARLHLHALRRVSTPHIVVGVCDTQERAAHALASVAGTATFTSLVDLLREAKPDLVHVCTPAGTHFHPARAALEAGAHVYVEQPFVEAPPDPESVEVAAVVAGHADLHAVLRANDTYGRLSVSLRARPVGSTLVVAGTGGTLTADFLRTTVVGAANPGTSPVEKAGNPLVEAWQMGARTVSGVARRLLTGGDYPGLAELIGEFYGAVAASGPSPVAPDHLRRVVTIYEK